MATVIDTHCHASPYWFEPVEILLDEMDRVGVDKAVLTQFFGVFDNSYLIESVKRFPGRFAVIAIVDHTQTDAPDRVAELHQQGVDGLRFNCAWRAPGDDPLALWRKCADLGVIASVMGTVEQYADPEFEAIIQEFPNLTVVMEHLAGVGAFFGPGRSDREAPMETYQQTLALSKYPNVYVKVPGLGEFCPRPVPFRQPIPFADVPPLIEMAVEAFGGDRLMWGSDFPPVANREGYRNALRLPMDMIEYPSSEVRDQVFGVTAANLWEFR
jgi:L-fuconolactonase